MDWVSYLSGTATGGFAGLSMGLMAAIGMCFYSSNRHEQKERDTEKRHAAECEAYRKWGIEIGKGCLQARSFSHKRRKLFGTEYKTLFVVYDTLEDKVRQISGHTEDYQLFKDIPPEWVKAITSFITASTSGGTALLGA